MSNHLPTFEPLLLRNLPYTHGLRQMAMTGCALRRPHWCQPVLVMIDGNPALDDEGELSPFDPSDEDRAARDWMMVERPQ